MGQIKRQFDFVNAEPLLSFISHYRDIIVGQHIRAFYSSEAFGQMSDVPLVFELDDFCVVVSYFCYSNLTLYIVDPQAVKEDLSLSFLYRDIPDSQNLTQCVSETDFPFIGQVISDIQVDRFSHAFEINPSTGETRPAGGDYFSMIVVKLRGGQIFHICAADALFDGYVETW